MNEYELRVINKLKEIGNVSLQFHDVFSLLNDESYIKKFDSLDELLADLRKQFNKPFSDSIDKIVENCVDTIIDVGLNINNIFNYMIDSTKKTVETNMFLEDLEKKYNDKIK